MNGDRWRERWKGKKKKEKRSKVEIIKGDGRARGEKMREDGK